MGFLNDLKDYQLPTVGGEIFKFVEGDNKYRLVTMPYEFYREWVEPSNPGEKKSVVAYHTQEEAGMGDGRRIQHVWSFVAISRAKSEKPIVGVLEIHQQEIKKALMALYDDPEWGSWGDYDLNFKRTGKSKEDTSYALTPSPNKKPITQAEKDAIELADIDFEKRYFGGNTVKEESEPKEQVNEEAVDLSNIPF